jgi:hypothetical protein
LHGIYFVIFLLKIRKLIMRPENSATPGLFNSISQPNLATVVPVSPTPQTPNGNTDVSLEESFDKKNDLSFEDESVSKVGGTVFHMFCCLSVINKLINWWFSLGIFDNKRN